MRQSPWWFWTLSECHSTVSCGCAPQTWFTSQGKLGKTTGRPNTSVSPRQWKMHRVAGVCAHPANSSIRGPALLDRRTISLSLMDHTITAATLASDYSPQAPYRSAPPITRATSAEPRDFCSGYLNLSRTQTAEQIEFINNTYHRIKKKNKESFHTWWTWFSYNFLLKWQTNDLKQSPPR